MARTVKSRVSFKQYEFFKGYDLAKNVAPDAGIVSAEVVNKATYDSAENSVQRLPAADVDAFYQDYVSTLEGYIGNQPEGQTVEKILGAKKVIVQEHHQLASGLPYRLMARTHNYSVLPDSLRHKLRFSAEKQVGGALYSSFESLLTYEVSLPELAGDLVSVSYVPVTAADM